MSSAGSSAGSWSARKRDISPKSSSAVSVKWGDAEAANTLLQMIIRREGFGNILAEGVKRASEIVGGPAAECAIYTMKGDTPRGHDHRARWEEMLDTCTGSGGTIDSGPPVRQTELGQPARINPFDPEAVAKMVGGTRGRRHFEDSSAPVSSPRARLWPCSAVS